MLSLGTAASGMKDRAPGGRGGTGDSESRQREDLHPGGVWGAVAVISACSGRTGRWLARSTLRNRVQMPL